MLSNLDADISHVLTAMMVLSFLLLPKSHSTLTPASPAPSSSCVAASTLRSTPATPTRRPSFSVTTTTPPGISFLVNPH